MSVIATKTLIDNDAGEVIGVRFEFANGNTFDAIVAELSEASIMRLAVHGAAQKLGDSYAGAKGKGLSVDECEAGVRDLWAALKAGQFGLARSGVGGKLLEAFIRWAVETGKTAAEARETFGELSKEQKAELRKAAPIKAKLAEIEAERAEALAAAAGDDDATDLEALFE